MSHYKFVRFAPEIEFDIGDFNAYFRHVTGNPWQGTPDEKEVDIAGEKTKLVLDKEYYGNQCEWKIRSLPFEEKFLVGMQDMLKHAACSRNVAITSKSPSFVGTHFHFWLEHNGAPVQRPRKGRTEMVAYIVEYFFDWFARHLVDSTKHASKLGAMQLKILHDELHRFVRNHNLWHYFDNRDLEGAIMSNLRGVLGMEYPFTGGAERPKYQPIVWSPATENGKPLTLEIRIIPNSFFMLEKPKEIFEFFKGVERVFNEANVRTAEEHRELHEGFATQIRYRHKELCRMYRNISLQHGYRSGTRGFMADGTGVPQLRSFFEKESPKLYVSRMTRHEFRCENDYGSTASPELRDTRAEQVFAAANAIGATVRYVNDSSGRPVPALEWGPSALRDGGEVRIDSSDSASEETPQERRPIRITYSS